MASSACRTNTRLAAALLTCLAAGASCSTESPLPFATPQAGVDLPPGAGRELLLGACLACHDLGGLDLFKGFYTRDRWHELVQTMVAQGAAVDPTQVEVLTDYLTEHFGPD
jgi:hypothetical protein